jgi:mono/diheme cytochrome c family protein
MQKTIKIAAFAGLAAFGFMATKPAPTTSRNSEISSTQQTPEFTYPENVMAIIDAKCMGCHKPDAKSEKGRDALQWEMLPKMANDSLSHALNEILEVLEEGEMPPAKAIERFPNLKLTDEEITALTSWAESELDKL